MKLKQLTVKNFVKFSDFQTIDFGKSGEGGVYYFVGANGTGKSSMVEAIRRCSAPRLNESCSNRCDESIEQSFAACIFEKTNNEGIEVVAVSYYMLMREKRKRHKNVVMKVLIVSYPEKPKQSKLIKLIFSDEIDETLKISNWYLYESKDHLLREEEIMKLAQCPTVDENGRYQSTNNNFNEVMEMLMDVHWNKKWVKSEIKGVSIENMFDEFTRMEFLFAQRGISPIESSEQLGQTTNNQAITYSRSLSLNTGFGRFNIGTEAHQHQNPNEEEEMTIRRVKSIDRYADASERAFVIRNFLENENPDLYNREKERAIFKLITSSTDSDFILDKGLIMFRDEMKTPILKVSEGIVEAKLLSILLSRTDINTLILDEPERGMHTDYTDILVNRVLTKEHFIGQKTVIITTHNKEFVAPSTLPNMVFFSRNTDGTSAINTLWSSKEDEDKEKELDHGDVPGTSKAKKTKGLQIQERKMCNFITSDAVSSVFFSRYSIFVEGITDAVFVKALKGAFLDDNSLVKKIFPKDEEQEAFRNFLATLNVIELKGEENKKIPAEICKRLCLENRRFFLLDRDTFESNKKRKKFPDQKEKLKEDLFLSEKVDVQGTTDSALENLKEQGVFIWNPKDDCLPEKSDITKGTLEHAIHETLKVHCELCKPCKNEAREYLRLLEKRNKCLIRDAPNDEFIEALMKNIINISLEPLLKERQIRRFIEFLQTRISKKNVFRKEIKARRRKPSSRKDSQE